MKTQLQPLNFLPAFLIYASWALLLFGTTGFAIPYVQKHTQWSPLVVWFVCGGVLVFVPLLKASLWLIWREGIRTAEQAKTRFWLVKPDKKTWGYSIAGAVLIMAAMGLIVQIAPLVIPDYSPAPSFMQAQKLQAGEYWILSIWGAFFFFNIVGEELFWRGYMWPRLQLEFGNKTWVVAALGWTLFHVSFGWTLLITLLPILIIQPLVMQKTQNTWSGIIIHALVNGTGFLLVTLAGLH